MPTVTKTHDVREKPATTGPRGSLWAFRIMAIITSLAVAGQPILAGYYLDGDVDALGVHSTNAHLVLGFIFFEAIAALIYTTAGKGRGWPLLATSILWFAAGMQIGAGYARELGLHIPLGVAIVAFQIGFTVWLFTNAARRPRKWGRR